MDGVGDRACRRKRVFPCQSQCRTGERQAWQAAAQNCGVSGTQRTKPLICARFAGGGYGAEAPPTRLCLAGGLVQTTLLQHRQPLGRGDFSRLKTRSTVTPAQKTGAVMPLAAFFARPVAGRKKLIGRQAGTGWKSSANDPTDRPTMPTRRAVSAPTLSPSRRPDAASHHDPLPRSQRCLIQP